MGCLPTETCPCSISERQIELVQHKHNFLKLSLCCIFLRPQLWAEMMTDQDEVKGTVILQKKALWIMVWDHWFMVQPLQLSFVSFCLMIAQFALNCSSRTYTVCGLFNALWKGSFELNTFSGYPMENGSIINWKNISLSSPWDDRSAHPELPSSCPWLEEQ